ncbi:hypothetical protein, partial [Actinomadura gamaensis]
MLGRTVGRGDTPPSGGALLRGVRLLTASRDPAGPASPSGVLSSNVRSATASNATPTSTETTKAPTPTRSPAP